MKKLKRYRTVCILSDGRKGHIQQSVAFARYLGLPYTVHEVSFRYRWFKLLSYVLDRLGIYIRSLYSDLRECGDDAIVVGTGSSTYYALKCVSGKEKNVFSVTMMLPEGYRYDYDLIFAQKHDNPPPAENIVVIPVNFYYPENSDLYFPEKPSIGIVIGGSSRHISIDRRKMEIYLDKIFRLFPEHEIAVTTSPRTSKEIEILLEKYTFAYKVVYSENSVNPIGDFFERCNTVFITEDSTSMISAAVTAGKCAVEILRFGNDVSGKYSRFLGMLAEEGYLHIFDGEVGGTVKKVDFGKYLRELSG